MTDILGLMFGLGKHGPDGKYAVILDIGSGSVGAAIVASDAVTDQHPIIYSCRVSAAVTAKNTDPLKKIEEALFQTFLKLSSDGIKSLAAYDKNARVQYMQVTIAAPWTHTVSQQAIYEEENEFKISRTLIEQLIESARTKVAEILKNDENIQKEALVIICQSTLYISANGYAVQSPVGLRAKKIYISHALGLAPKHLLQTLKKLRDKVFTDITIQGSTFILIFYKVIRRLFPAQSEYCLIDITHEATEVAVIRNFELKKVLHINIGSQTLLRSIEEKTSIPSKNSTLFISGSPAELTQKQKILLESIFTEYQDTLTTLFASMGDILTIPKLMYLHSDASVELFFAERIQKAAERSTGGTHTVISVTKNFNIFRNVHDSALFLSAYYFHTLHKQNDLANYK